MQQKWRFSDLLRGLGWGLLTDLVTVGLIIFLTMKVGSMAWAAGLLWAMVALAVTGFSIAEERYLVAGGFWLFQLGLFTLYLAGFMKLLTILSIQK